MNYKNQKNFLKTLKDHREKLRVSVNVRVTKIMHAPIKVGIRTQRTPIVLKP